MSGRGHLGAAAIGAALAASAASVSRQRSIEELRKRLERPPLEDGALMLIARTNDAELAARLLQSLEEAGDVASRGVLLCHAIGDIRAAVVFELTRACRVCGCTQNNACVVDGIPCGWADPTLCTACVGKEAAS